MRNTRKARFCLFLADLKRNLSHLIYLHRKLQSPLKTPKRRKNSRILQIMFFTSTFGLILDHFVIYCNVNQLKFNIMKTTTFGKSSWLIKIYKPIKNGLDVEFEHWYTKSIATRRYENYKKEGKQVTLFQLKQAETLPF